MSRLSLTATVVAALAVLALSHSVAAQDDSFATANKLYEEKKYDSAIVGYEALLKTGIESAPLYFNLGNAHFKNGQLGQAILNYMRARRLDPADNDITHNLEFARGFTRVQMEGVELNPIKSFFESIVAPYRLSQLAWISSAVFVSLFILLTFIVGLGHRTSFLRVATTMTIILLVISGGLTSFKFRSEFITRRAVVIAEESPVRTGPSDLSETELHGAPGLIVEILDESGPFYLVSFENKRRGWIEKTTIAEI